jgi:TonB dependent receptor/TonB-dependent Receptor Plug Domain/CarboxypepD_reg-like domain
MKKLNCILLLLMCTTGLSLAQKKSYTISGFIKEKGTKESLIGTTIVILNNNQAALSNNYGYYSISTTLDSINLLVSMVGYQKQLFKLKLSKDLDLDVDMESSNNLTEVLVTDQRMERISEEQQMSIMKVSIEQIQEIPALFGEKDVLKVLQLLPGVQKGSEGNSGLYVRGGGPDQNLIILDDAPVYNAFHLFGFFSLFNGDALKSVELTKGGFPARYGGRLSSVLEMNMKDGSKESMKGSVGIGLISSRFTLEGPLKKNKSSFLISARRTYIDALIYPFLPDESKGGYYFYDLNAKVNYDIDRKNKIYVSGYFGRDKFYARSTYGNSDNNFGLYWGNGTGTVRWNHVYSPKLFSNTSFIYSQYRFNTSISQKYNNEGYSIRLFSGIRDISLKHDFDYAWKENHLIKTGVFIQQHRFTPSAVTIKNDQFEAGNTNVRNNIDALESAVYIEDRAQYGARIKTNLGVRISHFFVDKKSYAAAEPRAGISYQLKEDMALKASYAYMRQYIHLLSGTGVGLPTDLWVPSTSKIPAQSSQQVAIGLAKDFIPKNYNISIEGYYKKMENVIAYKEGASFLQIDDVGSDEKITWEDNVTSGQGWSYGVEVLLKKSEGKFSGWVGYTLSWTQLQFDELNFGKKYYARYDRRHDISVVGIYKPREDLTFSATWVYGTGNAITLPRAEYLAQGHSPGGSAYIQTMYVNDYDGKNNFRMEAYHRLDIGMQFHSKLKRSERIFELSVYNLYNRRNPYFYYVGYKSNSSERVLKRVSLFPIMPSISWTYKF